MNVDDRLHGISTLIQAQIGDAGSQGTGFFYAQGEPIPTEPGQIQVTEAWIVTNRHVLLPKINNKELVPDKLVFNVRKTSGNSITWNQVSMDKTEFLKRAKFHTNKDIDIGIVKIDDILTTLSDNLKWNPIVKEDLPDSKISVSTSDDVVAIGYPHGFYDDVNIFPIIKSGIISSKWGANFKGLPYFLIDAKLFPGSSGSLVITKPRDIAVKEGKLQFAQEKQFYFLGIYSGNYHRTEAIESDEMTIVLKPSYNLGIVWYGSLVEEIIKKGISVIV